MQTGNGHPSGSLRWQAPANLPSYGSVSHYYIKVSSKISNKVLKEMKVQGTTTQVSFQGDEYLEPLCEYIFAVCAISQSRIIGDWNMVEGLIGAGGHEFACC